MLYGVPRSSSNNARKQVVVLAHIQRFTVFLDPIHVGFHHALPQLAVRKTNIVIHRLKTKQEKTLAKTPVKVKRGKGLRTVLLHKYQCTRLCSKYYLPIRATPK